MSYGLELRDRLIKLDPFLSVLLGEIVGPLSHTDRPGRRLDAGRLVGGHELVEALVFLVSYEIGRRDRKLLEGQAVRAHPVVADCRDVLARQLRRIKAFDRLLLDEKERQPLVALGVIGVGACQDTEKMGPIGHSAPGLGARQEVVVAVLDGPALHSPGIAAVIRLGKGRGAQDLAAGQPRHPALLLFLRPVGQQKRPRDEVAGHDASHAEPAP